MTLTNTIVAGNSAGDGCGYLDGTVYLWWIEHRPELISRRYHHRSRSLTNAPDLAPLGNYGGPTQTMPPLPGSPAIGAGNVAANTFTTDQRGYPRTQNGLIDIGAVEEGTLASAQYPIPPTPTTSLSACRCSSTARMLTASGIPFPIGTGILATASPVPAKIRLMFIPAVGSFTPTLIVTNSLGLGALRFRPVYHRHRE